MESVEVTSRKQTIAINQVYYSITQISAVVQSNTATAKQSSAYSEELSAQANLQREEVKKFKIINCSFFRLKTGFYVLFDVLSKKILN